MRRSRLKMISLYFAPQFSVYTEFGIDPAARDVDKFIGLAKKYTRITELTPEILHTFVSKIVIHERRERFKQNTEQQIDIYFRYIGNIAGI